MPLESLVEKIAASEEWQAKIEACESEEQAAAVVKEAASSLGETVSEAEIIEFINSLGDDELNDDELEAAAGGGRRRRRRIIRWNGIPSPS